MAKKTLRFDIDEDHSGFGKANLKPTKAFNLEDEIKDDEGYSLLSNDELNEMLENENLTLEQINLIKKILSSRK